MEGGKDERVIDANPTKGFFITMLTRDISLRRSIVDLVDNSVDAANQYDSLRGRWIKIEVKDDLFVIEDNCGGIEKEVARTQAFRFGRPDDAAHKAVHTVGRFGVGMKRTLFKLGRKFVVRSHHADSSFKIDVDVDEWMKTPAWEFHLEPLDAGEEFGTKIEVRKLLKSTSEQFGLDSFINNLEDEIGQAHFKAISKGLEITVNGQLVTASEITLKSSENLGVVGVDRKIDGVDVTIKAGVSTREKHEGGWYIICNGRLIEAADQSQLTGWGCDGIPKYHPDYAFFRGVVDFECDNSDNLPWTTTKTGVDADSDIYRSTKTVMQQVMRKILPFLKERAKEAADFKKELIDQDVLNLAIENAPERNAFEVRGSVDFVRPARNAPQNVVDEVNVTYRVKREKFDDVMEALGAESASQVGRETFDYYYRKECAE